MSTPIHQRTLIRQAVQACIVNASTLVGPRVFLNRMQPLWGVELPAILIYTEKEPAEICIEAPREYERSLELSIEIVASADATLDDTMDSICAQLEQCLFVDETFGGLVVDTILADTSMAIVDSGEKPIGATKVTLTMPYKSDLPAAPAPGAVNTMNTTDVKFQDNVAGGPLMSEDVLTIPQDGD
jgi:hypothetical protein